MRLIARLAALFRRPPAPSFEGWLAARVVPSEGLRTPERFLFHDYCDWMFEQGGEPMLRPRFGQALSRAGVYSADLSNAGRRIRVGIRLKPAMAVVPDARPLVDWQPVLRRRGQGRASFAGVA